MFRQIAKDPRAIRWWIAASFVLFAMLLGGGSRADVLSNIWLRPVAVLVGAYALYTCRWDDLRAHPYVVGLAAATVALTAIHLVPLPPSVWRALPGREIIAQVDAATGLGPAWRPLAMVPTGTWNALYSLSIPLAVFFLLLPMGKEELLRMLNVFIVALALTAATGFLQATGGLGELYDIANPNAGLFANRNHQAVVLACLFPMLAVFASLSGSATNQSRFRLLASLGGAVAIVPLLLVTGSRAGIAAALLAVVSIPLIVRVDFRGLLTRKALAAGVGAVALIGLIAWVATASGRNLALLRFTELDATEDLRYPVWNITWNLVQKYFPFGSGVGSFPEVFQIDEPAALLIPQYWNHAHNDWLESALVGGLPAVILLLLALGGYCAAAYRAFISGALRGRRRVLAKLGCIIIAILGLASVFDYPLRAPAVACLFVFATIMAVNRDRPTNPVSS
jgi:O-antigen ligase